MVLFKSPMSISFVTRQAPSSIDSIFVARLSSRARRASLSRRLASSATMPTLSTKLSECASCSACVTSSLAALRISRSCRQTLHHSTGSFEGGSPINQDAGCLICKPQEAPWASSIERACIRRRLPVPRRRFARWKRQVRRPPLDTFFAEYGLKHVSALWRHASLFCSFSKAGASGSQRRNKAIRAKSGSVAGHWIAANRLASSSGNCGDGDPQREDPTRVGRGFPDARFL